MAKRVVDQDPHDLGQPLRIAGRLERVTGKLERDVGPSLGCGGRELDRDHAADLGDVGRLDPQLERARLEP